VEVFEYGAYGRTTEAILANLMEEYSEANVERWPKRNTQAND
jgi:hypothetical protein